MTYDFLSAEWIEAVQAIRDEYTQRVKVPDDVSVRANLSVTDGPDGTSIDAHIAAAAGTSLMELGHLDDPEITITTDFQTARAIFADQDGAAAMAAFMGGKIRIDGDVSKLMVLMARAAEQQSDPLANEIAQRVRSVTSS